MNFKKTAAIVAAAGALTALAIPAMADTTFYGSARVATFYNINDINSDKNADVDEHLQGNSRFGADFKNGDVGGKVELGVGSTVGTRLMYGTWNFGSGTLVVGQDYNSYYLLSAQVHGDDNANNGYGSLWDARQAQIKVKLNNGVYFAAIQPSVGNAPTYGTAGAETAGIEIYLPKLNVGYAGKAGAIGYNVGIVGETYKNLAADKQVNAVLGYGQVTGAFGPTSFQGSLSVSQNAGDMGFKGRKAYDATNKKDAIGFEGYAQVGQKISDAYSVFAGFGYTADKVDVTNADKFDNKMLFFVNAPITLAKGVTVTPEFSYYDQLDKSNGDDAKDKQYAVGAKWQINF